MSTDNYLESFDDELQNEFDLLSHEFESLGLTSLEDLYPYKRLLLLKLIDNVHSLIKSYRLLVEKTNEIVRNQTSQQKEMTTLNNQLKSTKSDLSLANKHLKVMVQKTAMLELQIDECLNEKKYLNEDIVKLNKQRKSKANEYEHKINLLQNENTELTQKLTFGTFKSHDEYISDALNKYKLKEDIYKETIKELTNSNTAIMEEVINLREMIVNNIVNQNTT